MRLLILICIWSILLVHYPAAQAAQAPEDDNDAFMGMITEMPVQMSPGMGVFLKGVTNKIKAQWHSKANSSPITVLATFDVANDKAWNFYTYKSKIDNSDQAIVLKLVETILSKSEPPVNEPFGIFLVFDTYNPDLATIPNKASAKGGAQPDVDFGPYMASLQRKIKSNWELTKEPLKTGKTVVLFQVKKDGSVCNAKISKNSGTAEYDKAAFDAINNSSPFLPGPTGGPDIVDIQFVFDYQPSLKSKSHGNKLYGIHMEEPDVIMTDLANLKSVIKDFGH